MYVNTRNENTSLRIYLATKIYEIREIMCLTIYFDLRWPKWLLWCIACVPLLAKQALQNLHLKGFSPVCFCMCCLKLVEYGVEYWHWLQLWSFFPLCKFFLGSFSVVNVSIFKECCSWSLQQGWKITEHRRIFVIWRVCVVESESYQIVEMSE